MTETHTPEALWTTWKQSGKGEDLSPLLARFQPMIHHELNRIGNETIPPSALSAEGKKLAIEAFQTFDPQAGASLSTHVGNRLKKLDRYVYERQAVGRLPEGQILQRATFLRAEGELEEKLGRKPTTQELADHLRWSPSRVAKARKGWAGELSLSTDIRLEEANPYFADSFDIGVAMEHTYRGLPPDEQQIFEYTFGYGGREPLKTNREIAQEVGLSETAVRNKKKRIAQQLESFFQT